MMSSNVVLGALYDHEMHILWRRICAIKTGRQPAKSMLGSMSTIEPTCNRSIWLHGVGRGNNYKTRLWRSSCSEKASLRSSGFLRGSRRTDTGRAVGASSLRQSEMRKPGSSFPWYASRQYDGCRAEGAGWHERKDAYERDAKKNQESTHRKAPCMVLRPREEGVRICEGVGGET